MAEDNLRSASHDLKDRTRRHATAFGSRPQGDWRRGGYRVRRVQAQERRPYSLQCPVRFLWRIQFLGREGPSLEDFELLGCSQSAVIDNGFRGFIVAGWVAEDIVRLRRVTHRVASWFLFPDGPPSGR